MELRHPDDAISALLGAPVRDGGGRPLGRVRDVVARRRADGCWEVEGVVIARRRWSRRTRELPWRSLSDGGDGTFVAALPAA